MISLINIAIADRYSLPAKSLSLLLSKFDNFKIIGDFRSCLDLVSILEAQTNLSLLIVDFNEGDSSSLSCLKSISFRYPKLKIIVLYNNLCCHLNEEFQSIRIDKFISKSIDPNLLVNEILKLFKQNLLQELTLNLGNIPQHKSSAQVSKRESEIISLIAKGDSGPQIASKLFISLNTIKQHKKNIFQKLKIRNIQEVVAFAIKNNI